MKTLKDAIEIIMSEPPELHYPAYFAGLLSEADVPDKDDGECSEILNSSDLIRFYIPKDESIPTDLRLYVGENYIKYERTANGFLFKTLIDDEDEAMKVVQQIVNKMKTEHDESEHGVSWRTISLAVVPQEERYKIGTWVEWEYRVRDSY